MRKSYDAFEAREKICPVCGKRFYPPDAAAWVYKRRDEFNISTYICGWGCLNKYDSEEVNHGRKKRKTD